MAIRDPCIVVVDLPLMPTSGPRTIAICHRPISWSRMKKCRRRDFAFIGQESPRSNDWDGDIAFACIESPR